MLSLAKLSVQTTSNHLLRSYFCDHKPTRKIRKNKVHAKINFVELQYNYNLPALSDRRIYIIVLYYNRKIIIVQFYSYLVILCTVLALRRFANCMLYYGLTLNVGNLGGDRYIGFALMGLVEIPSFLLANFLLER